MRNENPKEDAPKPPRLKKFEALFNFREGFEEPAPPSNDYIAEAISLLTDKAGISLEDSRKVTIFKDDEGTICVDIVPPQEMPDLSNEDTPSLESLFEAKIEISLLEVLSEDNVETDTLVALARRRYGTELLWKPAFNFWLRDLEERGDIVRDKNGLWGITARGRLRLRPSRRKG